MLVKSTTSSIMRNKNGTGSAGRELMSLLSFRASIHTVILAQRVSILSL